MGTGWISLRGRFLLLRGLRWLPTGLQIPVMVLYVLDHGLTIAQYGTAVAVQAVVILLLELPTGGLADAIGARPVLLLANVAGVGFISLIILADSLPLLMLAWGIQGIYRALESGPLDAWYVNAALAEGDADVEGDMAKAGTAIGMAIGLGSLASSGLVTLAPHIGVEPLLLPLLVVLGFRIVELGAIALLVTGPTAAVTTAPTPTRRVAVARVPGIIAAAFRVVVNARVVMALLLVEVLWGLGFVGVEALFAPRLAEVLDDPVRAATLLGPISTVAWLCSAFASSAVPLLSRRLGPAPTAVILRLALGSIIVSMGLLGSWLGMAAAYLLALMVHVSGYAVHSGIFHRNIPSEQRTTLLSASSMSGHLGAGIGYSGLGWIAAGAGLGPALVVAGVVLALAGPLYLVRPVPTTTEDPPERARNDTEDPPERARNDTEDPPERALDGDGMRPDGSGAATVG